MLGSLVPIVDLCWKEDLFDSPHRWDCLFLFKRFEKLILLACLLRLFPLTNWLFRFCWYPSRKKNAGSLCEKMCDLCKRLSFRLLFGTMSQFVLYLAMEAISSVLNEDRSSRSRGHLVEMKYIIAGLTFTVLLTFFPYSISSSRYRSILPAPVINETHVK